jgi:ABC-type multidrug transport system fused ATPase/permease subunit
VEGATQEQIEEAARMAGAHEFIVELKDRYDTQVGEGGVKLSGGQAQRLCIARALLRDPRLLILDEATSHLDVETESRIMEEIITRIKGTRTVVIIAHRLSTIRAADQVVVLDHGRLVQYGSYDDLRSAPGPFRRMVELQADQAIL